MATSDYFPSSFIKGCTDDGIYYMRQLERDDGIEFNGLVWYGQHFKNNPTWANVFIGRLNKGVRRDENGFEVDEWEGKFFDVPKGKVCGKGNLKLATLKIINSTRAGCDFPEHYIKKVEGRGFGGNLWGIESTISGCWEEAPPIPPIINSAIRSGFRGITDEVVNLSSLLVSEGFHKTLEGNLTGTWVGDDGGSYYLTHDQETNEVVWYAESKNAKPLNPFSTPVTPARGWANVFWGDKNGDRIEGLWADVPRGNTRGAGRMRIEVESRNCLNITSVTGGYGGRKLWRVNTLQVTVTVPRLNINATEEDLDDPLLFLFFFKIDGESVNLDDLSSSQATFSNFPSIMVSDNIASGERVAVDSRYNSFSTILSTVRTCSGSDTKESTKIGVIAYAIEVDEGYSNSFRRSRYIGWRSNQEFTINSSLRRGSIPDVASLRASANRIRVMYLGPWEGWPWGDPDDILSGDVVLFDYLNLEDAFQNGTGTINSSLNFSGERARYSADVLINISSRLNSRCSD